MCIGNNLHICARKRGRYEGVENCDEEGHVWVHATQGHAHFHFTLCCGFEFGIFLHQKICCICNVI